MSLTSALSRLFFGSEGNTSNANYFSDTPSSNSDSYFSDTPTSMRNMGSLKSTTSSNFTTGSAPVIASNVSNAKSSTPSSAYNVSYTQPSSANSLASQVSGDADSYLAQMRSLVEYNNAIARENAERQYEFNAQEAQKNRDWQQMMSSTAHQTEVEDLKAAGLNPILSANSGASSSSGATASGSVASSDSSLNSTYGTLLSSLLSSATAMEVANTNAKTNLATAQIGADASKYGSDMSYASTLKHVDATLQSARINAGSNILNSVLGSVTRLASAGMLG